MNTERDQDKLRVIEKEVQAMHQLHFSLLLQLDQVDRHLQRLRWWTLTLAILLLCLTIVVWRLT